MKRLIVFGLLFIWSTLATAQEDDCIYITNQIDSSSLNIQLQQTQYYYFGLSSRFRLHVSAKREGIGPINLIFRMTSPSRDFFRYKGYSVYITTLRKNEVDLGVDSEVSLTEKDNKWIGEIEYEIDAISYEELTERGAVSIRIYDAGSRASNTVTLREFRNIRRVLLCIH